jgi:hypothetical protein
MALPKRQTDAKLSRNIKLVSVTTARLIPRNQRIPSSTLLSFLLLLSLFAALYLYLDDDGRRWVKEDGQFRHFFVKFFIAFTLFEHCSAIGLLILAHGMAKYRMALITGYMAFFSLSLGFIASAWLAATLRRRT